MGKITRSQQKEATRMLILETAKRQFSELWFAKTTIRIIAKEAGIAVGTLFVHFPDKSALLAATLHEIITQHTQEAFETVPASAPILHKLLHLARHLYSYYAEDPALSRILLKEVLFMSGEWGAAHNQQAQEFIVAVTALLQTAQSDGELPGNVNCITLAVGFFAHYLFVLITGLRETVFDVNAQIEILNSLLSHSFAEATPI